MKRAEDEFKICKNYLKSNALYARAVCETNDKNLIG